MPSPLSKKRRWAGRIMSAVAALFLLFDATIKLMVIPLLLRGRLATLVAELTGSPSARPAVRGPLTPTVIHRA
jgi:hypothetical protein